MSMRYPAGFIRPGFDPLKNPDAPTIGTLSNSGATSLSITFTAPTNVGGSAITAYYVTATDSSSGTQFTATGSSSPISITGLTTGNTYTAQVFALNSFGPSAFSAVSNSAVPAIIQGQQAYTTPGTYSWVAPSGVTSVSVVAVGAGGGNAGSGQGGGGGGLGYKNNITVIPGNSYTVVAGQGGTGQSGTSSYFIDTSTVAGFGGPTGAGNGNPGGTYLGDGGGNGGGYTGGGDGGGGGAGGYSGAGGAGLSYPNSGGSAGAGGAGAGGGGWSDGGYAAGGGGGGVGILGQGTSGSGSTGSAPYGGIGGSGGATSTSRNGALYGGGGGTLVSGEAYVDTTGGGGAVRIIWPGDTRQFPSTNTGDV